MKITNDQNLPAPLVAAITNDPYSTSSHSDITVTRLIQPPRKIALEKKHAKELTEDAADRIWALMGQLGHLVLERAGGDLVVEKRLWTDIHGWRVSGAFDLLEGNSITDYKFTSVYAIKSGLKPEWEQQLNLNAMLARIAGIQIKSLSIVGLLRDWSVRAARRDFGYPPAQVAVINSPIWSQDACLKFASDRVLLHKWAQEGNLPECDAEERWEQPAKWAVRKRTAKRALKLFDEEDSAQQFSFKMKGTIVEHRPGSWNRCEDYCGAAPFCSQYQAYKLTTLNDDDQPKEEFKETQGQGTPDIEPPLPV